MQMWTPFLMMRVFHMSSRLRIRLNRMELLRGRTGLLLRWQEQCLMNTRCQNTFGRKQLKQLVMQQIDFTFTSFLVKRRMNCSPVTNHKLDTFEYLAQNVTFLISIVVQNLLLIKSHEGFLLGYGSNSHTYRVYNNFTRKVEETVDVKFDETNGSQVEQLPLDVGD